MRNVIFLVSVKVNSNYRILVFLILMLIALLLSPGVAAINNIEESENTKIGNITNTTISNNIIDFNTEFIKFSVSNDYSIDVAVSITDFNISLNDLNKDTGIGSIKAEHKELGKEEAKMAQTGLCAAGIAGSDVPIGIKDNGSIDSTADPIETPDSNRASDIVDACTNYD